MEISFKDAIKMVHPDLNRGITDAGEKVSTIMLYKNDPRKMFLCLQKWGLIPGFQRKVIKRVYMEGLLPNWRYMGNVTILHKKLRGEFKVLKTTSKRVYFTKETTDRTGKKFCNIGSVRTAYYDKEE